MGEAQVCSRSLGATLVAAASSLALFAAANWEEFSFSDDDTHQFLDFLRQVLNLVRATFQPWFPLLVCVQNKLRVSAMHKRLRGKRRNVDSRTVAIITLCPILIEIPNPHDEDPINDRFDITINLTGLCPLQLAPKSFAEDIYCTASRRSRKFIRLRQPNPDVYMFGDDDIAGDLAQREALLVAELEPEYSELSYMRSTSEFKSLVTALQASGYLLSLTQRLRQHLDISPLEVFVAFYSVLTMSQLVMEVYSCGHYQRPLLLRPTPSQFSQYCEIASNSLCDMPSPGKVKWMVWQLLALLLVCMPFVLHTIRYLHSCPDCVRASVAFFIGTVVSIVPLGFLIFVQCEGYSHNDKRYGVGAWTSLLLWYVSGGCFFSTCVMSVVATIKYWDLFKMTGTSDWWAWVIPHVYG